LPCAIIASIATGTKQQLAWIVWPVALGVGQHQEPEFALWALLRYNKGTETGFQNWFISDKAQNGVDKPVG
jgi:hypothetical protein